MLLFSYWYSVSYFHKYESTSCKYIVRLVRVSKVLRKDTQSYVGDTWLKFQLHFDSSTFSYKTYIATCVRIAFGVIVKHRAGKKSHCALRCVTTVSSNGLEHNMRQTITWTNDDHLTADPSEHTSVTFEPKYNNERDGVSNHRRLDCLVNRLLKRRSKNTSKLRVIGLYEGTRWLPVDFSHRGRVTRKMMPLWARECAVCKMSNTFVHASMCCERDTFNKESHIYIKIRWKVACYDAMLVVHHISTRHQFYQRLY